MPGSEIQAEIVQAAASFHDLIWKVIFAGSHLIFDNPIAFHPSDGMFSADAQTGNLAIALFLFSSEFFAARFLHGLDHGHTWHSKALKASILAQAAALRQGQVGLICDFLIVLLSFAGGGKQEDPGLRSEEHT